MGYKKDEVQHHFTVQLTNKKTIFRNPLWGHWGSDPAFSTHYCSL